MLGVVNLERLLRCQPLPEEVPRVYVRHAGEEEGDCEELKHIPQGLDTTLLATTGEKALAVQTRGTVSIISLLANGAVGNSYTTPGQHPAAQF